MSPANMEPLKKRELFRWDSAVTSLGLLLCLIIGLYLAVYLPAYVVAMPWQAALVIGYGIWLTYFVALPKFAKAILGGRTGTLSTMDGTWRISEATVHELDPLVATIDYAGLVKSGIKMPKELESILKNPEVKLPQPGTDEKGRTIPAWYVKCGGYRMDKVWYAKPGEDGVHIFIGFPPIEISGRDRGACLISVCKPFAVPHDAIPFTWLKQLREDGAFVDVETAIWVHVEPSYGFVTAMRRQASYWGSVLQVGSGLGTPVLSALSAYALAAQGYVENARLRSENKELWEDTVKLRRALWSKSDLAASPAGRADNRPPGYDRSDLIPSESLAGR